MNEIVTTDFAKFGSRERVMAETLLKVSRLSGFPEKFEQNEITIMMNMNSGYVFFTNSESQVCMMNGDNLEIFYSCNECGHEGFKDEMKEHGQECCHEYLNELV